jgi:hypothetical protein
MDNLAAQWDADRGVVFLLVGLAAWAAWVQVRAWLRRR